MAARKKNATPANGPHSAAHTAASRPPAPTAGPPADGPAAAVWAALTAAPGATAAQIATAAGTSRTVAGQELAALEISGLATRTPGARNGRTTAPATWQPAPQAASPAPATAPAGAEETEPAGTADPPAESSAPADGDASLPAPGSGPAPDEADSSSPGAGIPGADETVPADGAAPGQDAATNAGTADASAADGPVGEAVPADGEPQPAPVTEAAVLLREVASAATQAAQMLDGGDAAATLAAVDAVCVTVAQSRRLLKAAASGRKPRGTTSPAARPGQLRDLVAAHLAGHPDADFTPHQIGRVLSRSSGAVANALDRLTALGQAHLTSDKPRRYRHQALASTPAPAGTA